jgi:hypothetical protein
VGRAQPQQAVIVAVESDPLRFHRAIKGDLVLSRPVRSSGMPPSEDPREPSADAIIVKKHICYIVDII